MIFVARFCLQQQVKPLVKETVEKCKKAGVTVRVVTQDNMVNATLLAQEAGIYSPVDCEAG